MKLRTRAVLFLASITLILSCTSGESPTLSPFGPQNFIYNCSDLTTNTNSPIGSNLIFLSYFNDSHWMFVDAFIKSSPWVADSLTLGWGGGTITSTDTFGWPTGVTGDTRLATQMYVGIAGQYPSGTYVIHWEGAGGTLSVDNDASNLRCEDGNPITNCPSRRGLFDVTPSDTGIVLYITPESASTYNSGNYIRNIRVILPGGVCGASSTNLNRFEYCASSRGGTGTCSSGTSCQDFDTVHWNRFTEDYTDIQNPKVLFHPQSMAGLRKFRAIRYQEYLHMQGTPVTSWASRTQKEDTNWITTKGAPFETTVYMSNLLNADAWLNIPHEAEDAFVSSLATFYQTNLNSNLDVYLEYSNEPWNPSTTNFPQSQYFLDRAIANNIGVGDADYIRKSKAYVDRAVPVFDVWTGVFGTARTTRLISSWGGFNDVAPAMLTYPGVSGKVDAIAVGPYIGIYLSFQEHETKVQDWTKETVFREFDEGVLGDPDAPDGALASTLQMITDNKAIADTYGVDLVGYESGGHLWAADTESNQKIRKLFRSVVTDSRFGQYYLKIYNHWRNLGGKLINHFAYMFPHRNDQFGMLPYETSLCEDNPKAGAVNDFIINNPCWWTGCAQ